MLLGGGGGGGGAGWLDPDTQPEDRGGGDPAR